MSPAQGRDLREQVARLGVGHLVVAVRGVFVGSQLAGGSGAPGEHAGQVAQARASAIRSGTS